VRRETLIVEIHPKRLAGAWRDGYALELQTSSSIPTGQTASGRTLFNTTRPPLGQLVYRLKYGDSSGKVLEDIVDTVVEFWRTWNPPVDSIVPTAPSKNRITQPVLQVAQALSQRIGIPVCTECVAKIKPTDQMKDVGGYTQRTTMLKDAFAVKRELTEGKNLLLLDDLYETGSTATSITHALLSEGHAKAVFLLTLTKTRK
jgi:predicted amidophosphoribosyltransferase